MLINLSEDNEVIKMLIEDKEFMESVFARLTVHSTSF